MTLARFADRTALITGGASGIGAATAQRLADEGALVIVADLDHEGAKVIAKEVRGHAVRMDVTDTESVAGAISEAEHAVGHIDVLVNNAGGSRMAMFLDTDEANWDAVLLLNLRGAMSCTRAVLPGMLERRSGSIVNVSSEAGHIGTVAGAAYSAAKGGILGFTKSIARETARLGVRCNAVAPGPIDTPLLHHATDEWGDRGTQMQDAMVGATAMARLGTPEEVAAAIAFLASADASFITGETLAVSGGLSMS
jgi:2-hydroxycyclohexanecarboxyl-CoA dehydrogenase